MFAFRFYFPGYKRNNDYFEHISLKKKEIWKTKITKIKNKETKNIETSKRIALRSLSKKKKLQTIFQTWPDSFEIYIK